MSDPTRDGGSFPWANMVVILAAITGAISWFADPILSSRPVQKGTDPSRVTALQNVQSRLWEDPFGVALSAYRAEKKEGESRKEAPGVTFGKRLFDLRAIVGNRPDNQRADGSPNKILILPVLIPGGPYAEQAELRRRSRHAVLSGLARAGYVPEDGDRIGYFRPEDHCPLILRYTQEPPPPGMEGRSAPGLIKSGLMPEIIPFEFCRPIGGDQTHGTLKDKNRILVLWVQNDLPEVFEEPDWRSPLHQLGLLGAVLEWDPARVKVIGPRSSTELQKLAYELAGVQTRDWGWKGALGKWLNGLEILAATPTISNEALRALLKSQSIELPEGELLPRLVESSGLGIQLRRTIASDDVTAQAIVDELRRRGINLTDSKAPNVAILAEWDTLYGRALPFAFACKAQKLNYPEIFKEIPKRHGQPFSESIHYFSYLRGIDGRKPGETPQRTKDGDSKPEEKKLPQESTEGEDQSDYLRRLASEIQQREAQLREIGGSRFKAIGVLGSDTYDTLMILRALRKSFPEAIFFTNNYDARLAMPDEMSATHNLVVVTPYGPTLDSSLQQHISPFRDSYQTGVFAATLCATNLLRGEDFERPVPRVFEVGRDGLYDLSETEQKSQLLQPPSRLTLQAPIRGARSPVLWATLLGGLLLGLLAFHVTYKPVDPATPCRSFWFTTFDQPILAVAIIALLSLTIVSWLAQHSPVEEPFYYFSGISVWPTATLRLMAALLAIYFIWKGHVDVARNLKDIEVRFALPAPGSPNWNTWSAKVMARAPVVIDADYLWLRYIRGTSIPRRILHAALYSVAYVMIGSFFMREMPLSPARGDWARGCDGFFLKVSIFTTVFLVFYVFEVLRWHCRFITWLNLGTTPWSGLSKRGFQRFGLLGDAICEFMDIRLIAQHSAVVSCLIRYPFIVVLLMLSARSRYFDGWTWPPGLIMIFTINLIIASFSSLYLYRVALCAREQALRILTSARHQYMSRVEPNTLTIQVFDETISDVRNLTSGAFAPFWQQPVVRSILYSSGGIGVASLLQAIPRFF